MSPVTPFSAGDARDPRQAGLTALALVCWALPMLALISLASYTATGASAGALIPEGLPSILVFHAGPAIFFGLGIGVGLVATARSTMRSRWTSVVVVMNGVGLIAAAILAAVPAFSL